MIKTLNLKTLIQGTNVKDKARLLFADLQSQEDAGATQLLTSKERDALWEDARKHWQVRELNHLIQLYNLSMLAAIDVKTAMLGLQLALCNLLLFLSVATIETHMRDELDELLFLAEENRSEQPVIEAIQKVLGKTKNQIGLFQLSGNSVEKKPDLLVQQKIITILDVSKKLAQRLYVVTHLSRTGGMNFLSESDQEMVTEAEKLLGEVVNLDNALIILKLYRDYIRLGLMVVESFEPSLRVYLSSDASLDLALTDAEKASAEQKVERLLHSSI